MGKMTVTQTELVWLGKPRVRNESPQVRLPFHLRERLASGQAGETGKESWRNKLLWGDNLYARLGDLSDPQRPYPCPHLHSARVRQAGPIPRVG